MKLQDEFLKELQAIIGQPDETVSVSDGPRVVRSQIEQCEPLAVAVSEFVLKTNELANADISKLKSASQSLCQRVNYLLEPISPIETDADGCVVQMRSNPPLQGDNSRCYYELLLRRGGSIELCRYEKQSGTARVCVPATLTHEVLGRLVADFNATVDEILAS